VNSHKTNDNPYLKSLKYDLGWRSCKYQFYSWTLYVHNIHALCPVVLSSVGWLVIFKWVSEWLLFNAKSAIFQIYHGEYSYLQIAPTFIYNWTTYGLRYEYRTVNYLVNACFSKILPPPFLLIGYWLDILWNTYDSKNEPIELLNNCITYKMLVSRKSFTF
jgi:hypothetical protein